MNKKIYKLKALTNLHAGSGDLSFGVVDKLVQRDPVSRFPVIHATSMKGSLKEFCECNGFSKEDIDTIFGRDDHPGKNKFFSAHLLLLPVRSNVKPFFKATCPAIIGQFIESLSTFGLLPDLIISLKKILAGDILNHFAGKKVDFLLFQNNIKNVVIDDWINNKNITKGIWDSTLIKWFGEQKDFVLLRDDVFMEICEDLPVVARNQLGEHRNLWYEELVPRQSEFWFIHLFPENDVIEEIRRINIPVQIGANASVGYGFCEIIPNKISTAKSKTEKVNSKTKKRTTKS